MSQSIRQETSLQAILELSAQVKENRDVFKADIADMKTEIVLLKMDVTALKEDVKSIKGWMAKTDERLETIDAKMDVFAKACLMRKQCC
ncbi:outer membrane murein-binding lipoprotein Lpp [Sporosarcina luteola]|nr:outer membrane murein-binding lipoprotein Lpp [Sporosarcina luteola]